MKKLAVTAILALSLMTLAACGDKSAADTGTKTSAANEAEMSVDVDEPETQDLAAEEEKMTVEEFVQTDEVQSQVESVAASLPEGWTVSILAEGDALVYHYSSPNQFEGEQIDIFKQSMDEQFTDETMDETFSTLVDMLKAITTAENPTVIVRYLNPDGTAIWEKVYDPQ